MMLLPTCWRFIALGLLPTLTTADDVDDAFSKQCLSFHPELIPSSTLTRLEYIANGTKVNLEDNDKTCGRNPQEVSTDLCRVALQIPTSKRSSISFELWLPRQWSGARYLATGNGGLNGCVKYEDLAYGTANGFATMGTNNGHNGTSGEAFFKNPDIVEDFSYRALHTGTVSAKKIIEQFYGEKPHHSYYVGCSLGGRMGVKAAEAFPDDYDGIVAGCPAIDFNNLQGQRAMFYHITGPIGSPDFITADQWKGMIHNAVLEQCDHLDGVVDGIIEVPSRCFFDPSTLLCQENETSDCLNSAQVKQVQKIYAPYEYDNGELIFPRMNPGNEKQAVSKLLAGQPFSYSQDWFRYVVLDDPDWDAINYNRDLVRQANDLNPSNIRTFPETLPAFKTRGAKIIIYHGGQDNQITSFNTERFWDQMARADPNLQDYFRFFRISGMFHCSAGPGAWVLGQSGGPSASGIPFDPQQNVLSALVAWVEKGKAPETLTGTKFIDDDVSKGIDFQRSHCPYPKVQTYIAGDRKLSSSWTCVSQDAYARESLTGLKYTNNVLDIHVDGM